MTADNEFRILLEPERPGARTWRVRLLNCAIPLEIGDKGTTTSQFPRALLNSLRSETFMPSAMLLQDAGRKVWDSLMTADLRASFNVCHRQVVEMAHGTMRIVIVPRSATVPEDDPMVDFAELPYELLRRPQGLMLTPFVGTNVSTPISRGITDAGTLPSYGLVGPLRILVVIADPRRDFPPINAAEEKAAIQRALAPAVADGRIVLEFCEPPTLGRLYQRIRANSWHVVHFAGHGGLDTDSAFLAFVDSATAADPQPSAHKVSAETLVTNLNSARELKLIVLTSCVSAQSTASGKGFDSVAHYLMTNSQTAAVVAMQFDFETAAAEVFSKAFYEGITTKPIDILVTDARVAITQIRKFGLDHRAWANPTVLWRSKDGQLFYRICGPDAGMQLEINTIKTTIEDSRKNLLKLFKLLANLAQDVRRNLQTYRQELQDDLRDNLKRQSDLLGETVRLLPPESAAPGEQVQSSLVLRLRQATQLKSFRMKIRVPRDDLDYVQWQESSGPSTRSIVANRMGDDIEIVYLDTAANPQELAANAEHELGKITFRILPNRPASIVDLKFSEEPQVQSPQQVCFNSLGGLVIIRFPEA